MATEANGTQSSSFLPDSAHRSVDGRSLILVGSIFLSLALAWEAITRWAEVPEYLVPAPSRILATLWSRREILLLDFGVTLLEAALGFLLANVCALIFGVLFFYSRTAERSLLPILVGFKSVPIVATAPLFVLWFGYGLTSKVVMAAIVAFFPMVIGLSTGLRSVNSDAYDLMRSLTASRWEILTKLSFPSAVPHALAALKVSTTLAVVGAIVAELMGARRGLGFTILMASYNVDTPMLFCAIVLSAIAGAALYSTVMLLEWTLWRFRLEQMPMHDGLRTTSRITNDKS